MSQKGIILIHGAGLGSFIWNDVKPRLDLPALALDFPNRNQGDDANRRLQFRDYTDAIIQQVEAWDAEKLILVTHSIGGCVGLPVAAHFKDRLAGFIGIGATIPAKGGSFISCLPFPQKIMMPLLLRIAGTRPPAKAIATGLCHDLPDEQKERIVKSFTPESAALYIEKCHAPIPDTERLYIKLAHDAELPPSVQNQMAKNLEAQHVATLPSGHLPMLSHAEALARLLNSFCQDL